MYKIMCLVVMFLACCLFMMSCSGSGGGVMPGENENPSWNFEPEEGLSEMIFRDLAWEPNLTVDGSGDNEQQVDASDVRIYSTSFMYTMDVHPCTGDSPPPYVDQSLVVVAWEEYNTNHWDVKWAVRYYDASADAHYWGSTYTVPNASAGAGDDCRAPAVTAYIKETDLMTVDVVYQKRVDSGTWQIHHCRYRQGTSENYGSFSLDSTLHPSGVSEQVSGGSYAAINPDVVWYGRLDFQGEQNISILHCAYEQDTDANGGVGGHEIMWSRYVEGDTGWLSPAQMSESNNNYYPEQPRIDAGTVDSYNSGNPIAVTVWQNQVWAGGGYPADIDIWIAYNDAETSSPSWSTGSTRFELAYDKAGSTTYDAPDHYAVYPYVDIDYPRNDDEENVHVVWTHCKGNLTNDPTVLYWNNDEWSGGYPNPMTDLDEANIHEGLAVFSLTCGDGLETAMVAYVKDDSSLYKIWRADLEYTGTPSKSGVTVVSTNQTYLGFTYNTWGPAIATHEGDNQTTCMHIFWGDKGSGGSGTPQIMEDFTNN